MDFCVWKFCVSQNPVRSLIIIHIIFIHIICFGKTKKKIILQNYMYYMLFTSKYTRTWKNYKRKKRKRYKTVGKFISQEMMYMVSQQIFNFVRVTGSFQSLTPLHNRVHVHGVTANLQLCKSYRLFSEPHSISQEMMYMVSPQTFHFVRVTGSFQSLTPLHNRVHVHGVCANLQSVRPPCKPFNLVKHKYTRK